MKNKSTIKLKEETFLEDRLKKDDMKLVTTWYNESGATARLVGIYERPRLFFPSTWSNRLASLLNEKANNSPYIGQENFIVAIDANSPEKYYERIDKVMNDHSKEYGRKIIIAREKGPIRYEVIRIHNL